MAGQQVPEVAASPMMAKACDRRAGTIPYLRRSLIVTAWTQMLKIEEKAGMDIMLNVPDISERMLTVRYNPSIDLIIFRPFMERINTVSGLQEFLTPRLQRIISKRIYILD